MDEGGKRGNQTQSLMAGCFLVFADGSGGGEQGQPGGADSAARKESSLRRDRAAQAHLLRQIRSHEHHAHQQKGQEQHEGEQRVLRLTQSLVSSYYYYYYYYYY